MLEVRSFKTSRSLKQVIVPKWDLWLVLNTLTREPFEPDPQQAGIIFLSMKTLPIIFLVAAKR
jgi:hypothetical protein